MLDNYILPIISRVLLKFFRESESFCTKPQYLVCKQLEKLFFLSDFLRFA
jgi:hypothetical protein